MERNHPGTLIQKLGKEKGITQEEFAEALCLSVSNVSRIERGEVSPSPLESVYNLYNFPQAVYYVNQRG